MFNNGGSTITCVVRSMSEDGGRLGVEDSLSVPAAFTLQFSDGRAIDCVVAWRLLEQRARLKDRSGPILSADVAAAIAAGRRIKGDVGGDRHAS